ncbi:uncharacterized protein LOC135385394 [Ornithodoros turicata]|uniref:uncharacterized protein LOC135385394 n=1 Tax=Ornithodoros turicata TaxID=34597 RepID=UPI00313A4546
MTSFRGLCFVGTIFAVYIPASHQTKDGTPLETFFQQLTESSILMKQCYRNGTSLEPQDAVNITVNWDGARYKENDFTTDSTLCFAKASHPDEFQCTTFIAKYNRNTDSASITGKGKAVKLSLLRYNGKAYFFKQHAPRATSFKIYDTDFSCVNALQLFQSLSESHGDLATIA